VVQAYYALQFLRITVGELEEHSIWRKAMLGRYGRQSVLQWANTPVIEIEKYARAVVKMIRQESSLNRASEDG